MTFAKYNNQYKKLTVREKILVQLSSILTVAALLFLILLEPGYLQMQQAKDLYAKQQDIAKKGKEQSIIFQRSLASPAAVALEEKITALQFQYDDIKEELYTEQLSLISGPAFGGFIKRILLSAKNVNIDDFQVNALPYAGDDEESDTDDSVILKQQVSLTIRASDENLKNYLHYLETQSVVLVWDSLLYNDLGNNERNVTIKFHLYSAKE